MKCGLKVCMLGVFRFVWFRCLGRLVCVGSVVVRLRMR